MKKKILILSQEQPPVVGGAGIIAKQLFDILTEKGWDTSINKTYSKYHKIIVLCLSFLNVIRSRKYHRVIINDLFYKKIFCLCFKIYAPKNTLVYLHGSEPEFLLSSSFYREKFITLCLNSIAVVAVSNYMKEKFLESLSAHSLYSEIEKKIVVIKNGINTKVFNSHCPRPKGVINIATCCRLEWGKGFEDMTSVFINLLNEKPNSHWYIAGEGKDSKSIKAYILEKNISLNVTFLGSLSSIDVSKLFNTCHFMLLLSNFKESLGLVYMEASCCGCHSIGRNNYGVVEAIINGKTGTLVNSVDEVIGVILDNELDYKNISNIAVENYSNEHTYQEIELLF
jgi:glycosyltransferase involved in cell wall biosynthesis